MTDTVHLGLPVIEAAQAQKHVTHNEALVVLDALVMLAVIDRDLSSPPAEPAAGDRYIVKAPGAGGFAGKDDQIAHYLDGSWSFHAPATGWTCYVEDEAILVAWDGGSWQAVSGGGGGGGGPITELQDLDRLGLGTTADATNPFAARLNNALWVARPVADGGDGHLRYKLSKESADKTLSFLFQDDFSGRAEIGLTGDDDFHFKVSADGSAWTDALIIDKASALTKLAAGVCLTGVVSPAQITSDQNDYDPAGLAGASVLRLSSDASRAITGLAGGADGRIVFVHNSGTQAIVLKDESASSTAANRFGLTADVTLGPDAVALLQYDGTASRWRAIAGGGGGSAAGALRYDTAQSLSASEQDQALANLGLPPASLPLLFRNRLINGDLRLDIRNEGAAQTITAGAAKAYTVDRFYAYCAGANVTGQRVAGSGQNQYLYQFTGAAGVTKIGFAQRISAANIFDLNGETVTFSLLLANSLLSTVTWTAWYADSADAFGTLAAPTRTQIATGTFTVDGTLQKYSAQIALPAGAANGVEIEVSVGAQISGTWTIGKLQLEAGAVANPVFQPRPEELERLLCYAYAEPLASTTGLEVYGVGQVGGAARALGFYAFKATKRATPTLVVSAAGHWAFFNADVTSFVPWVAVSPQISIYGMMVDVGGMSGLGSAGDAALWGPNNNPAAKMLFDCEL